MCHRKNFDLDRDSRKVAEETRVGFVKLAGSLLVAHWNFLQIILQFVPDPKIDVHLKKQKLGRNNFYQNGLSEKEIKAAFKLLIGMGGKLIGNQMG